MNSTKVSETHHGVTLSMTVSHKTREISKKDAELTKEAIRQIIELLEGTPGALENFDGVDRVDGGFKFRWKNEIPEIN